MLDEQRQEYDKDTRRNKVQVLRHQCRDLIGCKWKCVSDQERDKKDVDPVKYRIQSRNASAESGISDDLLCSLGICRLSLAERNVLFFFFLSYDRSNEV